MNSRNKKIVLVILLIITLIAISLNRYSHEFSFHYKNEILEEVYAENFKLNDELSYYSIISENDENILLFWSTSCPHCETVLDYMFSEDVYLKILNSTLTVCIDRKIETAEEISRNIPVYFDFNQKIIKKFECENIPTLFIVDSKGKLIARGDGGQESIELVKEFIKNNN